MEFLKGSIEVPLSFIKVPWSCHGVSMEFHNGSMEGPWISVKFRGGSMEFPWSSMEFHQIS